MEDYSQSVMVALVPASSDWTHIDLPHLTVVYCGQISDLKPSDHVALMKDVMSAASLTSPMGLPTLGVKLFGIYEEVRAIRVRPTSELMALRHFFESWNKSEHKEFNPHVTVGAHDSPRLDIPQVLYFNQLLLSWGNERFYFNLR